MVDEKNMCNCGCGGGFFGKKVLFIIGVLAFVYGLMSYFMVKDMWPAYQAWMVGGALLVVIYWVKKMIHMHKSK